jgi:glycosidase
VLHFASAIAVAIALGGVAAPPPPPRGAELAALAQPPVRTSIASQRIYFVMTDRYANGDPSNDRGGRTGQRTVTGFDPTDPGWFHGGDLEGLTGDCTGTTTGLARLKGLGFTAVWVTPPFGQRTVQGSSAAYHGYWGIDFTSVDPHLGTNEDFAAFVDCAHRLGLKVFLDVVVNHTGDVILPTGGSSYLSVEEAPYRDCRGRAFDPARYAGGRTFPCLAVARMPRVPTVFGPDRAVKKPVWLNDVTKYHNRGDIDFSNCEPSCLEHGDFFGLDDLFTEQPAVVNGLAVIYGDWIRRYKIDGFRVDTAKHVDRAFFRVWVPKIRAAARAAGVRDFELFGEVFDTNAMNLVPFVRERGLPNVLDFPFQEAATGFAAGESSARGIAARLADDDYFVDGRGIAHTPPTFLGNHDMGRAALKIDERTDATGAELLRRVLLGYALMYFLRGAPVVYYGDEAGLIGTGGDKAARHDLLFATQVPEWKAEPRLDGAAISAHLAALGKLRDEHPALSTGASVVRHAVRNVLVVSRIDAQARREYVVAFNSANAAASVTVTTATGGTWRTLFGGGSLAGRTLRLPALSATFLQADAQLPFGAPARPQIRVGRDDLSDQWRVTATAGAAPVSVAFAVRRANAKRWLRLSVDDSPPYRAFLDPRRFRRNERVQLVAVARSLDGRTALSAVTPFVVRP